MNPAISQEEHQAWPAIAVIDDWYLRSIENARKLAAERLSVQLSLSDLEMLARCTLGWQRFEQKYLAMFDDDIRLIGFERIAVGTPTAVFADAAAMVTFAHAARAKFTIAFHNHPNNFPEPSKADLDRCREQKRVFECAGIGMLDWAVVSACSVTFLRERGLPAGLWRKPKADPSTSEHIAARLAERQLTGDQTEVYSRAKSALRMLSQREGRAIKPEWVRGEFQGWLAGQDAYQLAGFALDGGWSLVAREIVVTTDKPLDTCFVAICRWAVQSCGQKFMFAVHTPTPELSPQIRSELWRVNLMLWELGELQLVDVVHLWPQGSRSLRDVGVLDCPPDGNAT